MKALASRMAHAESSKPGMAADEFDVIPTRQSLSRSLGEPRLEASKIAAGGTNDAGDRVGLTWLRGPPARKELEDGGAAWATADPAPERMINTAVKKLRRNVPLQSYVLHSTRIGFASSKSYCNRAILSFVALARGKEQRV